MKRYRIESGAKVDLDRYDPDDTSLCPDGKKATAEDNSKVEEPMLSNRRFWVAAGERAVKSAAQCLIGLWIADGFDLLQVDWQHSLGVGAGAVPRLAAL